MRANHPLRAVRAAIDFDFVRKEVAHCYGKKGKEVLESLFVRTVAQCVEAQLADADKLRVDASLIDAIAGGNKPG